MNLEHPQNSSVVDAEHDVTVRRSSSTPATPSEALTAVQSCGISTPSASEVLMRRYFHEKLVGAATQRFWALRLVPPVVKQTLKYGPGVSQEAGMSLWRLFLDCWATCRRDECWPSGYYKFKLYREDRRHAATRFVHERIGLFVMKLLNDRDDVYVLDDKLRFAAACSQLGLPHVETIAFFEGGKIVESQFADPRELPREDLFIKSTNLLCGRGVERWRYDSEAGEYVREGRSLDSAQLVERVRAMSEFGLQVPLWKRLRSYVPKLGYEHERDDQRPRPYIIQKELKNHAALRRFTNGALCTVRVVTARASGGEPQLILAALRMPTGSSSVDNFAAGGLASPIELETGRLGKAVYKDPRKPPLTSHPDSGERIEGETVPLWEDVLQLCLRAHGCFPKVATVGWDVAITTDGPKLVEANPGWCVELIQMAHAKPLGETAWPDLLMSHAS